MGANAVDPVRIVIVLVAFLVLAAVGFYLCHRVVTWARTGARFRDRRLVYAPLTFLMIHGLTLTLGGFALVIVVVSFRGAVTAAEFDDFLRAMWVCFAVGPALALVAWVGLLYARRATTRAERRNECA